MYEYYIDFILSHVLDPPELPPGSPQLEDERSVKLRKVSVINYMWIHTYIFFVFI